MKRCVVVGNAGIRRYSSLLPYLRSDDYYIFCDGGLRHASPLGVTPDLAVGDFDSGERPSGPFEIISLPREKDDTDSVSAVREAIARGFDEFLLLGVFGGRLDHSLGNLSILLYLDTLGKRATAADDFGDMEIISRATAEVPPVFSYFSLLALTGPARGVTVEDAKYPLRGAEITPEYAYGISNEPLPGRTARISVQDGRLLLVRVREE